jgi:hypothetical protein
MNSPLSYRHGLERASSECWHDGRHPEARRARQTRGEETEGDVKRWSPTAKTIIVAIRRSSTASGLGTLPPQEPHFFPRSNWFFSNDAPDSLALGYVVTDWAKVAAGSGESPGRFCFRPDDREDSPTDRAKDLAECWSRSTVPDANNASPLGLRFRNRPGTNLSMYQFSARNAG